jgi:hypothetical protein
MKSTISIGRHASTVQRVKWQYVSLAAGLGLAAVAAIGLGGHTSSPAHSAPLARSAIASIPAPQDRSTVVFYLAKSPKAAVLAQTYEEMAQWVRYGDNVPEPKRTVVILDATTDEASVRAKAFVDESMAAANFTSVEAPQFILSELR